MTASERYVREGHPTIDELALEQGVVFPKDPSVLAGDFWPEEESVDDFLELVHEQRGHHRTDPAA